MQLLEQTSAKDIPVNIGIEKEGRKEVAEGLSRVLADTYTLYLKTHFFHWNVTGQLFHSLHEMFEEQYKELADAVDTIAERIRTLGFFSPGSYAQFQEMATLKETIEVPPAMEMVRLLIEGNETLIKSIRDAIPATERTNDDGTNDLYANRLRVHEKNAWMLRAILNEVE